MSMLIRASGWFLFAYLIKEVYDVHNVYSTLALANAEYFMMGCCIIYGVENLLPIIVKIPQFLKDMYRKD